MALHEGPDEDLLRLRLDIRGRGGTRFSIRQAPPHEQPPVFDRLQTERGGAFQLVDGGLDRVLEKVAGECSPSPLLPFSPSLPFPSPFPSSLGAGFPAAAGGHSEWGVRRV